MNIFRCNMTPLLLFGYQCCCYSGWRHQGPCTMKLKRNPSYKETMLSAESIFHIGTQHEWVPTPLCKHLADTLDNAAIPPESVKLHQPEYVLFLAEAGPCLKTDAHQRTTPASKRKRQTGDADSAT
ncbi:hypothetical protein ACMFMG_006793 [Clarireedia jacksonii]